MTQKNRYGGWARGGVLLGMLHGATGCDSTKSTTILAASDIDYLNDSVDVLCEGLNLAPVNEHTVLADDLVLSWDTVNVADVVKSEYAANAAIWYDVYVDEDTGTLPITATASGLTEGSYVPDDVDDNTVYLWQVEVVVDGNGDGVGDQSCRTPATVALTVGIDTLCYNLHLSPGAGASVFADTVVYSWDDVTPHESLGVVNYWFEIATSNSDGEFNDDTYLETDIYDTSYWIDEDQRVEGETYLWNLSLVLDFNDDYEEDARCQSANVSLTTAGLTLFSQVYPDTMAMYLEEGYDIDTEEYPTYLDALDYGWDAWGIGFSDGTDSDDSFDGYPYDVSLNGESSLFSDGENSDYRTTLNVALTISDLDHGRLLENAPISMAQSDSPTEDYEYLLMTWQAFFDVEDSFGRLVYTFENPTANEIVTSIDIYGNMGSDDETSLDSTDADESSDLSNDDHWAVTDDSNDESGDPCVAHLFYADGGASHPNTADFAPNINESEWQDDLHPLIFDDVTIPAGGKVSFALFVLQDHSCVDARTRVADLLDHLDGTEDLRDEWDGVNDDIRASIVNFDAVE